MGRVSAASTTTAGPSCPLPHMISSFSMIEPSELSIEVGESDEMRMEGAMMVEGVDEPLVSISRGNGRLESEGAMMVEGVDDVNMELE